MRVPHLLPMGWLAIAVASGCTSQAPSETVEATTKVPVAVAAVQLGSVESVVLATGTVVAAPGAELVVSAPMPSRVRRLPFGEGQHAPRGAVLVEFDIPSLAADTAARRSEVAQARARLTQAQSALERVTGLFERGIAAKKEVEAAQRELEDADAAVTQALAAQQAATQLATRATVRAPFAGLVAKRWHNPGDLVDGVSTDPVLRLVDPTRLQVDAQVPAPDAVRVRAGQAARIRVSTTGSAAVIDGRVLSDPAVVDPATASANVRVEVLTPRALPLSLPVEVAIVVERCDRCVTVPAAAIVREQNTTSVYIVSPDGRAHRQLVTLGLSASTVTEVRNGLEPGARIVIRGHAGLPDGAAVAVSQ